jgi:hypothetical protein
MFIKASEDRYYPAAAVWSFDVSSGSPWTVRAVIQGSQTTLFTYATQQEARDALAQLVADLSAQAVPPPGVVEASGTPV